MANRITGRVSVLVNGDSLLNKEGAKANNIGPSGEIPFLREGVYGDTGLHGFKETAAEASIEVSITDRDDISLSDLLAIDSDATVLFQAEPSGKVYKLVDAFCTGVASITAGEGETPLKFIGTKWHESTR